MNLWCMNWILLETSGNPGIKIISKYSRNPIASMGEAQKSHCQPVIMVITFYFPKKQQQQQQQQYQNQNKFKGVQQTCN